MPTVDHIANVSFKDHFLSELLEAPVDGSIRVNNNTFDITFVDGKVNARFTSGNRFTNSFRTSTLVADDLPDAPSRKLVEDLLNLGFGLMHDGLPSVARDPETGFIAAFAIFAGDRLVVSEFPSAFEKFAAFAQRLADRLDEERRSPPAVANEASVAEPTGFDIIHV